VGRPWGLNTRIHAGDGLASCSPTPSLPHDWLCGFKGFNSIELLLVVAEGYSEDEARNVSACDKCN
jgi:hypothetical protein